MRKLIFGLIVLALSLNAKEIYATFSVQAHQNANLAFSSSGIVNKILVDVGSTVEKNDILAQLQNNDLMALYATSKTSLKYAKRNYDRQVKVKKIIDASKFDSYEQAYQSAKIQTVYQKAMLNKSILRAPFHGIITSKYLDKGAVVSGQSPTTIFNIQSIDNLKLLVKFDSKYWQDVKKGDNFKYKLDGDTNEYNASISKVYPTIDTKTRMISAEVIVKNLPIGLFGTGYIITQNK